jgi:hypothetical protein
MHLLKLRAKKRSCIFRRVKNAKKATTDEYMLTHPMGGC